MSSPQPISGLHQFAMPWILQTFEEYEKWAREWAEYVDWLTSQNEQLKRSIRELESEKRHVQECKNLQEQVIDTQNDLISSLKNGTTEKHENSHALRNPLQFDPTLPHSSSETEEAIRRPRSCTSEAYSAQLVMALSDSMGMEAELE